MLLMRLAYGAATTSLVGFASNRRDLTMRFILSIAGDHYLLMFVVTPCLAQLISVKRRLRAIYYGEHYRFFHQISTDFDTRATSRAEY